MASDSLSHLVPPPWPPFIRCLWCPVLSLLLLLFLSGTCVFPAPRPPHPIRKLLSLSCVVPPRPIKKLLCPVLSLLLVLLVLSGACCVLCCPSSLSFSSYQEPIVACPCVLCCVPLCLCALSFKLVMSLPGCFHPVRPGISTDHSGEKAKSNMIGQTETNTSSLIYQRY